MFDAERNGRVAELLAASGHGGGFRVEPLAGGGNNRVYRVHVGGAVLLLKEYYRHPDDPRDRLGTEFAFSRFAWDRGVRCIPRPFAADGAGGLGLYEFVAGGTPRPDEVDGSAVREAGAFFRELNRHRDHPAAAALPAGSEACFTVREHLDCVERRLRRLVEFAPATPADDEAARFVRTGLAPAWASIREQVELDGADRESPLPADQRCLSPSDFGFHNAIRAADGRLRFVDFEYAGWDDPAKTVCDFLCQPAVPVPPVVAPSVPELLLAEFPRADELRRRAALLLPVYRLKWCCILLNEFLPAGHRRRSFARSPDDAEAAKRGQLAKAVAWKSLAEKSHKS